MAQLKDTMITGDASVTGTLYPAKVQGNTMWLPTTSSGTTYGAGTSGQVMKTNGTTVYWGNEPTVPTNISSFNNDAGYLTLSTLPLYDGTVT